MANVISIQPLLDFKLRLAYDDGIEGVADLSHLTGRGIFSIWNEPGVFEQAYIGQSGQIAWSDEIDLCPDALYLKITGKTSAEFSNNFKSSEPEHIHA